MKRTDRKWPKISSWINKERTMAECVSGQNKRLEKQLKWAKKFVKGNEFDPWIFFFVRIKEPHKTVIKKETRG